MTGEAASRATAAGLAFGLVGVVAFSFTLPMTRLAVTAFDPFFIAAGRAVVAAVLAIVVLALTASRRPRGRQWGSVAVVALGVVFGFPIFTTLAMESAPASHGAVVIGLLPAATAVVAVWRAGERPSRTFWLANVAGVVAVVTFVSLQGSLGPVHAADVMLLCAVVAAAIGYAEGGLLSRELGSWQTICWALVVALPFTVPVTILAAGNGGVVGGGLDAWLAFGYLSAVSMFLGFFAWYRGLAIGPISAVGQVQLVQPLLTVAWAALLFGERIGWLIIVGAVVVVACAAIAVRARVTRLSSDPPASVSVAE